MKLKLLTLATTVLLVLTAGNLSSQPAPPPPPPPQTTSAPIDNGVLALLIAVGLYGYMQLRKKEIA